jgi:hypothetical protein
MFQVVDTLAWRLMIRVVALVNDVFDEPRKDAICVQGLQAEVATVK